MRNQVERRGRAAGGESWGGRRTMSQQKPLQCASLEGTEGISQAESGPCSSHVQGPTPTLPLLPYNQPGAQGTTTSIIQGLRGNTTSSPRGDSDPGAHTEAVATARLHLPLLYSAVPWLQPPVSARFTHFCGTRGPPPQPAGEQSWLNSKENHNYLKLCSSQQRSRGDCSSLIVITFCFVFF